jgi:hypothetical protein
MEVGSREQALRIQVCMQPGHWSAVFLPGRFERARPVGSGAGCVSERLFMLLELYIEVVPSWHPAW